MTREGGPHLIEWYTTVVSGECRGALASILRGLLALFSLAYAALLLARRAAYAVGLRSPARAARPVVSIGNLVAGGTGKTPFTELLARKVAARGMRPAILSRGYGAAAGGGPNDEYLVLEENLPGTLHVQDASRVRAAGEAVSRGADVLLLDDGFQHWRIARDVDLVLLDALAPFGPLPEEAPADPGRYGRLLPRGLLREPAGALARASAIVITRADLAPPLRLEAIRREAGRLAPRIPIIEVVEEATELVELDGATARDARSLDGRAVFAFSGIGNPSGFTQRLASLGARVVGRLAFGDHHAYRDADVLELRRRAVAAGAEVLVTTQKDAVKLRALPGASGVLVLKIRAAIRSGDAEIERLLDRVLVRTAAPARGSGTGTEDSRSMRSERMQVPETLGVPDASERAVVSVPPAVPSPSADLVQRAFA